MKMTLGTIEDICTGRNSVLNQLLKAEPKPPVKVGYWLGKNARHLRAEFKHLKDQQRELILSLGAEQQENNLLALPEGDEEAATKWDEGCEELRGIEVEVDIHVFSLDELKDFNPGPALFEVFHFMFAEKEN